MNIPLKLRPACRQTIWGGTKLKEKYGKQAAFDRIAEAWEFSCHPGGLSVIDSGPLAGQTLLSAVGDKPLLVKLIDAAQDLSVQVHPSGENGKTEMWVVLEAEEGWRSAAAGSGP